MVAFLVATLAVSSALAIALGVTDPTGSPSFGNRFLVWNLFLAWIPMWAAWAFTIVQRRWALLATGTVWLAFLPNAPYLVTDLVHLGGGDDHLWRHVLQYGVSAWTGVLLGIVSLRLVHLTVEQRFGRRAGWGLVATSTALCAVGVVIGRFQRWNSWDLVTRPGAVLRTSLDWMATPWTDLRSTGLAAVVAILFGAAYLTIWSLGHLGRTSIEVTSISR